MEGSENEKEESPIVSIIVRLSFLLSRILTQLDEGICESLWAGGPFGGPVSFQKIWVPEKGRGSELARDTHAKLAPGHPASPASGFAGSATHFLMKFGGGERARAVSNIETAYYKQHKECRVGIQLASVRQLNGLYRQLLTRTAVRPGWRS